MKSLPTASLAFVSAMIFSISSASAIITITTEKLDSSLSTSGTFAFSNIPSNSSTDFANNGNFVLLDGAAHAASGPISNLTDGPAQTNDDSIAESFFTVDNASVGARIQIDLGSTIPIAEINTYSRHIFTRTPQIFSVYGAVSPTVGTPNYSDAAYQDSGALVSLGYTLIGTVNTLPPALNQQHGVSIAGEIGNYRYILFEIGVPLLGSGSSPRSTFFGEIDIVQVPEPSTAFLSACGLLALMRRRRS